ncbi:ABC transporter substrate-binding protein [Candidatus Saccharibacteria bacterium]|nr:ABC transporter substrate-binding protein [Candidatus Saccharibacteria bacterium]
MVDSFKKRGQKFLRKFSRVSVKASTEGKEHIKENLIQRLSHIQNIRLLVLEWSLLVLALIMIAATQAFWFGNSYASDVFVDGGSYTEATIGKVNSMNPLFATTSSEKVLSKLMFATLTEIDYSGNPGLGLIKSLRAEEDGKVWKIKLRDNLKWSDGEPLTNEDVLFTINLIQDPAVKSIYEPNLKGVKVAENENGEIVFTLAAAYADFATALEIPVVPKHELEDAIIKNLVEDDFSTTPVTSGAFTFNALQSVAASDEEVVYLTANPNYYLGRPMLNSFAVHTYADREDIIDAINNGVVTATAELSGIDANKVTSSAFYKKDSGIAAGVFMFFNTTSANLKNVNLRSAIRGGIDISAVRAAAPDTIALNYPLISSQIQLSDYPQIPGYDFDAAKAKIDEIKGETQFHLDIATVKSGYLPDVSNVTKEQLEALGIEAQVTVYDETQDFIANVISKRSYDILIYEIELGADPDPLPYYHSSQASTSGLNLSNYSNSLVDDLLVGARETLDPALRAKKYESFLDYWISDVPAIGLYQANLTYIYNKNVRTYNNDVRLVSTIDRFSDILNFAAVKAGRNKTP